MIYSAYSRGGNFNTLEEQRKASLELISYGLEAEYNIKEANQNLDYSPLGKPFLRNYMDIHISLAHCRHGVTAILSRERVGIDIEKLKPYNIYAARKILDEVELKRVEASVDSSREFFRYWTLKESYIKAIGMGFSYPTKSIHFVLEEDGQVRSNHKEALFSLYEHELGFIVAVCQLVGSSTETSRLLEQKFTLP